LHVAFVQSVTLTLLVCWFDVIGAKFALVPMCRSRLWIGERGTAEKRIIFGK